MGLDLSNAFFLLCITHDAISPKIINVYRGPLFSHTHNGSLILFYSKPLQLKSPALINRVKFLLQHVSKFYEEVCQS